VNLFKRRQPKRFSYTPRQLKEQHKDTSYEFDPQWRQKTQRKKKPASLLVLLIILGMVIVIWYVLNNYGI
jgi:cytoskeletal protein RodZ